MASATDTANVTDTTTASATATVIAPSPYLRKVQERPIFPLLAVA